MKKTIALLLCLLLALSLFACGSSETAQGEEPTERASDTAAPSEQTKTHRTTLEFNGLTGKALTLTDVEEAEGRACDFSFDESGTTVYAFNDMTVDGMHFSQVQFSFGERVRISCTLSGEEATKDALNDCADRLTELYGTPSTDDAEPTLWSWTDEQGNYAMLSMINDTTMQLAYYFIAE